MIGPIYQGYSQTVDLEMVTTLSTTYSGKVFLSFFSVGVTFLFTFSAIDSTT